jgi:shikimate kinase
VSERLETLRAALAVGEELFARLSVGDMDSDVIRSLLARRRELIASCDDAEFTDEERALARSLVELDARVIALCGERSRVVATAISRVRQRAPQSAPGRVLSDLA